MSRGEKALGEAFFLDLAIFRDEQSKGSGGLYGLSSILSSMFPCTLWNLALSVFTSQNSAKELESTKASYRKDCISIRNHYKKIRLNACF